MKQYVADLATVVDDVKDLRALCLTVDLASLAAAAEVREESKGSVSRRISRLERALGVRMLRRSPVLAAVRRGLSQAPARAAHAPS